MRVLTLPQMRLAQLQTLTENSLKISESIPELQESVQQIEEAFETFKKGMQKEATSSERQRIDKERDTLVNGFMYDVKAESYFPHGKAHTEKLKEITTVAKKYGFALARLPFDEETAQIDNLLAELETIGMDPFGTLNRWLPHLDKANQAFKEVSEDYMQHTLDGSKVMSATNSAPVLEEALEGMFSMVYAHAKVSKSENMIETYNELSVLIEAQR